MKDPSLDFLFVNMTIGLISIVISIDPIIIVSRVHGFTSWFEFIFKLIN